MFIESFNLTKMFEQFQFRWDVTNKFVITKIQKFQLFESPWEFNRNLSFDVTIGCIVKDVEKWECTGNISKVNRRNQKS